VASENPKTQDLDRDRVGHGGTDLTTDQGVRVEHTDDSLAESGRQTSVFVRFSTVAGSRGSADTVRDVRGFATKLYTRAGNCDLVGNNAQMGMTSARSSMRSRPRSRSTAITIATPRRSRPERNRVTYRIARSSPGDAE
jgi:hypothetical protein